jgi:hypothetical protein
MERYVLARLMNGSCSLDLLRNAWHGQLLASKHDQARSIRMSFSAVTKHNRLAKPTSSRKEVSLQTEIYVHTKLMDG